MVFGQESSRISTSSARNPNTRSGWWEFQASNHARTNSRIHSSDGASSVAAESERSTEVSPKGILTPSSRVDAHPSEVGTARAEIEPRPWEAFRDQAFSLITAS